MTADVRWLIGAMLACAVALAAWRAASLSASGAAAAAIAGTVAVGAGWDWGLLLVAYFAVASLLSRFRAGVKETRTRGRIAKHSRRDAMQVLANGGVYVLAGAGHLLTGNPAFVYLGAGALAASTADTWATELGTLSRRPPRSILTWRSVPAGTSGGVTLAGFLASVAGALFIGALGLAVGWGWPAALAAVAGGVGGSLDDSALGASVQERRWCARCDMATEQRTHVCGAVTEHAGGWTWMDNDAVNALSTVSGGVIGALVGGLLT